MSGSSVVVIPTRMGATRLPGKPLLAETGKPLIQHVWESACRAQSPSCVIIATDDRRIADAAAAFGARAEMTSPQHPSGTDRIAEVARRLEPGVAIIVNVQGDEPEIDPESIDLAIALLEQEPEARVATLAAPILEMQRWHDPACVKVAFDHAGWALYFSRSPIPYLRHRAVAREGEAPAEPRPTDQDGSAGASPSPIQRKTAGPLFQHVGLYAYRRHALAEVHRLPPSPLEQAEGLEQLRWLQAGWRIRVGLVQDAAKGIDTPEDYRRFVDRCRKR